jgi:hypothetical protein
MVLKSLSICTRFFSVEALEADQDALAAALVEQVEELGVVGAVDARLADPADLERDQGAEELLHLLDVGGLVVVDEEEELAALGLEVGDLGHHLVDRAAGLAALEVRGHRAELAHEMAAASGLDEAHRQVVLAPEDAAIGSGALERGAVGEAVDLLGSAVAVVVEDLGPQPLGLAHHHRLGIARDLVGLERGVEAAHHHRHAAAAVLARDLVGALGGVGLDAHGDEVGGLVERDRLHAVVVEADLDLLGREAGDQGRGQRLHLPTADVALARDAADAGMNERESHVWVPDRPRPRSNPEIVAGRSNARAGADRALGGGGGPL